MSGPLDLRKLAKAISRRRRELLSERPFRKVPITPAMSRILEADEDYVPYRPRKAVRVRDYRSKSPALSTIVQIAAELETTVGNLLGERPYRITDADRRHVLAFIRYLPRCSSSTRLVMLQIGIQTRPLPSRQTYA